MSNRDEQIVAVGDEIRAERYAECSACFVGGSLVRGEGNAYSDLDLVVVYPAVKCAYQWALRTAGASNGCSKPAIQPG